MGSRYKYDFNDERTSFSREKKNTTKGAVTNHLPAFTRLGGGKNETPKCGWISKLL